MKKTIMNILNRAFDLFALTAFVFLLSTAIDVLNKAAYDFALNGFAWNMTTSVIIVIYTMIAYKD